MHVLLTPLLVAALLLSSVSCGRNVADDVSPSVESQSVESLSVVLVTIDCLRADHTTPYGYERETTPHLAALAEESVLFERAYATAPFTAPSHASLFTSLHAKDHGVRTWGNRLAPHAQTMAELFRARDYATGAFYNHPSLAATDALRGFETSQLRILGPWNDTLGDFFGWLDGPALAEAEASLPFASWVHLWDVHRPYGYRNWTYFAKESGRSGADLELAYAEHAFGPEHDPRVGRREEHYNVARGARAEPRPLGGELPGRPLETRAFKTDDWQSIADRYDAAVRFADEGLGELVRGLRERDLLERTLLIVTADHGEALGEREACLFTHDPFLFEETLHVPLLVRLPEAFYGSSAARGARTADLVSGIDLLPTMLEAAGLEIPSALAGRSLVPTLMDPDGAGDSLARPVFAETQTRAAKESARRLARGEDGWLEHRQSVFDGRYKLIRDLDDGREQLFDLREDPEESRDLLAAEKPPGVAVDSLRALLDRHHSTANAAEVNAGDIDCEERRRLVQLGYLPASALEDCD